MRKARKTKNCTVEDRKAPGCQATETLGQCSVKPYKRRMTSAFAQIQDSFPEPAKAQLEAAEEMSALLKKSTTRIRMR